MDIQGLIPLHRKKRFSFQRTNKFTVNGPKMLRYIFPPFFRVFGAVDPGVGLLVVFLGLGVCFFGLLSAAGVVGAFRDVDFERLRVFRPTLSGWGPSVTGS